jgi:CHAT domain-containing protein
VLEETGTPRQIDENLSGTAGVNQDMGRSAHAIRLFTDAIDLCLDADDCLHAPLLLVELADVQQSTGQLRECLSSLQREKELLDTAPDAETSTRLYMVWAVASSALGDRDAARDQMLKALAEAKESGIAALQCDALVLLSNLYRDLDAPDRARSSAEEALVLAIELGDSALERAALKALGDVDLITGDGAAAADRFSEALIIDESTGAYSRIAQDLIGRGGAYSLLDRDDEARSDLHRAAEMSREAGQESALWVVWLNLADSFEESAPDSAAWYYDAALASLEHGNDAVGGEAMNTGYLFSERGRAYEEITRYYATRHNGYPGQGWDAKAFETAERSRARGLLEFFGGSIEPDGPEVLELIDSMYEIDTSTAEGRALRNRKQRELADMRRAQSAQSGVAAMGLDPVSLGILQGALPTNTLLLQYAVGDSVSLLWIVDSQHTELLSLPGRAELRRRVRGFRDAIAQPGTADEILLRDGHALYQTLLAEAASQIGQREYLVIVADDVLLELPFEALLEEEAVAGATWSEQPFFGREHSLVYAPSSTVYLHLRERSGAEFDRQLLALGDADYSGLDSSKPLEPLPFTKDEVTGIGSDLAPEDQVILIGSTATEPALKTALHDGSSRVVHLATHGLIDPAEPMRSCVALGAGPDDDGYLYSLEILALPLDNPMVVLSACESALGRLERGEGVVGLTRSFLGAGAQGVVASLWPVSDASTATLMAEFYDSMWTGRSAAVALRDARSTLLEDERWGHPYFWSAFVLIGTETMPW